MTGIGIPTAQSKIPRMVSSFWVVAYLLAYLKSGSAFN
jgi:hypothetical protein